MGFRDKSLEERSELELYILDITVYALRMNEFTKGRRIRKEQRLKQNVGERGLKKNQ